MSNSRDRILEGSLVLPEQIVRLVGVEYRIEMEAMFKSIWHNYLKNKSSVSSVYWLDRFKNPVAFNKFVMHLSRAGWIVSTVEPKRNWAEIRFNESKLDKWVSKEEVLRVREFNKFCKYQLEDVVDSVSDKVKTSTGIKSTGIDRLGFAKASSNKFKYDVKYIAKYREAIELNLTKSIRMLGLEYDVFADEIDYASVSKAILEHHLFSPDKEFTLGGNISDSRGRAIHKALGKVFNPISYKDARALLVCEPRKLSWEGLNKVYLAIAELLGYKPESMLEKSKAGRLAYENRELHELDLSTEDDRKDLYENIWLERIYDALDGDRDTWNVPIELDATASMLQIEGTLLGHKPFLEMTNVIGDKLLDAWSFDGISRKQFKKAMTPLLYGSSKDCRQLWKQNKIEYTSNQVRAFNREIRAGKLAVADKFKEFIIQNVQPKETMTVKIWNEEFEISCNRYRNVGDYTRRYDIFSTAEDRVISIYHTHTHKVADLKQFRRYFVTLLIHNLDSQCADRICLDVDWVLPIHDAFIVHPNDGSRVKEVYCSMLNSIYLAREEILKQYFASIGIDSKASVQWNELKQFIIPVESFSAQASALK